MTLTEIFKRQVEQQQLWHSWEQLTPDQRAALTKELALGLYEEVAELVRRVDRSRYHILQPQPVVESGQVAHDTAEALKMLVALSALNGVSGDLLADAFDRVTKVVDDKWRGQNIALSREVNVLLCDLDGVVFDWQVAFREFARARGVEIPFGGFNDPALEPLKDEFDRSGGYLTIPPMSGAVEALTELRRMGVTLVIVTARPYQRIKRVYGDTLEACERIGLKYDHALFFRDKAEAARRVSPANIVGMVEDRAKHAIEVALAGVKVFKMPGCESHEHVSHPNIHELTDGWPEVVRLVKDALVKRG